MQDKRKAHLMLTNPSDAILPSTHVAVSKIALAERCAGKNVNNRLTVHLHSQRAKHYNAISILQDDKPRDAFVQYAMARMTP